MQRDDILRSIGDFPRLKIVVVGDLFLDEYVDTSMVEISREGPFPVLRFERMVQTAGAAGNLAASIRGLGAQVVLVALVGEDSRGELLKRQLADKGVDVSGVLATSFQPTLTYTKIRSRVENSPSQELFRIDVLPEKPLSEELEGNVLERVGAELDSCDAVIVLDQIHQLVAGAVLEGIPGLARRQGVFVQGSSREHIGEFRGFDLITPNDRETSEAVGGGIEDVQELGESLKKRGDHRQLMLTLGADGMALFPERGRDRGGDRGIVRLPSYASDVADVTGAGDSVSSVSVLGGALGWDLRAIGWAASHAAAVVISKIGTHHLSADELRHVIEDADDSVLEEE